MVRLRSPAPAIYGGIPERPKGADCKSVVTDFAGPNPASPTITRNRPLWSVFCYLGESGRQQRKLCRIPQVHSHNEEQGHRGILRYAEHSAALCTQLYDIPTISPRIAIPGFPIICSPFHTFPYPTLVVGFLLCREPGRQQRKL